jgi:DNA-3-methyladenine glycosylase II
LIDVWRDEHYIRLLRTPGGLAIVDVENRGTIDDPEVWLTLHDGKLPPATRAALGGTVRTILGLDVDPVPLRRLAEAVPKLRPTALALRGMRPPRFASLFEAFANVVPFQQVSLDAGVAIVGRFVERFGESIDHDGRRLHAFPTAATVAGARLDALESCGLSRQKAATLHRAARAIESGEITAEELSVSSTDDATRMLVALSGIGRWSASVILLRGLGRLDVFPPGDVGAVRGLTRLMGLPDGPSLDRIVERFGDRKGYLYFFSLGKALLVKGLVHAAPPPRDGGALHHSSGVTPS